MECTGICKNGMKCKRIGSLRCFQHQDNQCSICMENMSTSNSRELGCTHKFHKRCLERWKRTSRTCPMCRVPFDTPTFRISINIQCIHNGQRTLHTYDTTDISNILESFGLDENLMDRSIADISFDIEHNESIDDVLRSLGVSSYRLPGSNTITTT